MRRRGIGGLPKPVACSNQIFQLYYILETVGKLLITSGGGKRGIFFMPTLLDPVSRSRNPLGAFLPLFQPSLLRNRTVHKVYYRILNQNNLKIPLQRNNSSFPRPSRPLLPEFLEIPLLLQLLKVDFPCIRFLQFVNPEEYRLYQFYKIIVV